MKVDLDNTCQQFTATSLAWCAFIFTLISNFFCTFTVQDISLELSVPNNTTNVPLGSYYSGLWNYKAYDTYYSTDGETLYITTLAKCSRFPEGTEMDSKWKTAQAFSIIATISGGMLAIGMSVLMCYDMTEYWIKISSLLMLTCICQGIIFIFLKSNACNGTPSVQLSPDGANLDVDGKLSSCNLGSGGILSIVSVVVWFLAGLVAFNCGMDTMTQNEEEHNAADAKQAKNDLEAGAEEKLAPEQAQPAEAETSN